MPASFILDPDAVLDYAFSWVAWLADNETIESHTVTAEEGVTVDESSEADGVVTVWLSHGTLGVTVKVTCHIVTDQGREDDRSLTVRIANR